MYTLCRLQKQFSPDATSAIYIRIIVRIFGENLLIAKYGVAGFASYKKACPSNHRARGASFTMSVGECLSYGNQHLLKSLLSDFLLSTGLEV